MNLQQSGVGLFKLCFVVMFLLVDHAGKRGEALHPFRSLAAPCVRRRTASSIRNGRWKGLGDKDVT